MSRALIIHPQDPDWVPATHSAFVALLDAMGLLALPARKGGEYAMGPQFATLISFIGCSPTLFQPSADGEPVPLFDLQVAAAADTPVLLCGMDAPLPRCPTCRQSAASVDTATPWTCAHCGSTHSAQDWRWSSRNGLARFHIRVCGIVEGTALPGDALLAGLQQQTGITWRHCYCR